MKPAMRELSMQTEAEPVADHALPAAGSVPSWNYSAGSGDRWVGC